MFTVAAFYKFAPLSPERVLELQQSILEFSQNRDLRGLFLLGPEGCNATMAGDATGINALIDFLQAIPEMGTLPVKYSTSDFSVFDRLKVEIRPEIVTLLRPDIVPDVDDSSHLSPEEWHRVLTTESDFVLLDTRNTYETRVGKFKNVLDPQLEQFSDFPAFVEQQQIPKEKKILMYCTGGIRCEKASVYMKRQGYRNVYQLDGGILNYLEQFPDGEYEGECFVFDRRVAVDRELKPSQTFVICTHCGDPGNQVIVCNHCGKEGTVCSICAEVPKLHTCSKNCAYHYALRRSVTSTPKPTKSALTHDTEP